MATWRFTATFWTPAARGSLTSVTKPHPYPASAESDAISGLEGFLDGQGQEHGDNLQWVALERSDSGADSGEHEGGWVEVKRLQP